MTSGPPTISFLICEFSIVNAYSIKVGPHKGGKNRKKENSKCQFQMTDDYSSFLIYPTACTHTCHQ